MNISMTLPCLLVAALLGQGPVISFDRTAHAFGRIPPKAKVQTRFEIRNTGDAVLELREVQTSCGCTTALPEKRSLKPGEGTLLEVQYDPHRDRGLIHRGVSVFSNDPKRGRADLELQAEVVPSVLLSEYTCYFQGILRSERMEKSVRCFSSTDQAIHFKSLEAGTAPYLRAEAVQAGKELTLKLSLDASKLPANMRNGQQVVSLRTDDPDTPEVNLDVYWAIGDAVQASPIKLAFDPASKGTVLRLPLKLHQQRGKAFRVLDWRAEPPFFQVEGLTGKPAAEQALTVALTADAPAGVHAGSLIFTLDDPDQRTLVVEVMAFLK